MLCNPLGYIILHNMYNKNNIYESIILTLQYQRYKKVYCAIFIISNTLIAYSRLIAMT